DRSRMEKFPMKTILCAVVVALCFVNALGQAKTLTNDPLTGLPLSPATDGGKYVGNEPDKMPDGRVCKSTMKANFYITSQTKSKMDAATAWYAYHLAGFKKVQGYEYGRAQVAFYNSDGTIVIFLTGSRGDPGENTDAYSIAYERYQPGLSEKTIASLTQGKIV